jgi:hypothetical protein
MTLAFVSPASGGSTAVAGRKRFVKTAEAVKNDETEGKIAGEARG